MKRALTLLLLLTLFATDIGAGSTNQASASATRASDPVDPRAKRDKIRKEKARKAAELDALQSDAAQVEQALTDLENYVSSQEGELTAARAAEAEAADRVAEAQAEVQAMEQKIAILEGAVKKTALQAFTHGAGGSVFETLVSGTPDDVLQSQVMFDLAAGDVTDALDELASAHRELKAAQDKAQKASERAEKHRLAVEGKIADLKDARIKQQALGDSIDARIDDTLLEAANLEQIDKKLSGEIAARELALAARVQKAKDEAAAKAERDGAGTGSSGSSDSGSDDSGNNDNFTPPPIPEPVNGLVTINGITVDASIGPAVAQLVEWASQQGINLTGGGFRRPQDQIAVRRANCGPSAYDIWQKPSSQCRPPAARPGKSMHEKGLAVDFACNGELISNYSHWCYKFISNYAPKVGLKNRGVEAWHWSTNGN